MDAVSYFDSSGRIAATYEGQCLEQMDEIHTTINRVEGLHSSATHYIDLTDPDNPTPIERPASPVSRTDLTLLAVPTGSKLYINGESYDAEGTVELEFPLPGTYALRVECFPFLDWTDQVVV